MASKGELQYMRRKQVNTERGEKSPGMGRVLILDEKKYESGDYIRCDEKGRPLKDLLDKSVLPEGVIDLDNMTEEEVLEAHKKRRKELAEKTKEEIEGTAVPKHPASRFPTWSQLTKMKKEDILALAASDELGLVISPQMKFTEVRQLVNNRIKEVVALEADAVQVIKDLEEEVEAEATGEAETATVPAE